MFPCCMTGYQVMLMCRNGINGLFIYSLFSERKPKLELIPQHTFGSVHRKCVACHNILRIWQVQYYHTNSFYSPCSFCTHRGILLFCEFVLGLVNQIVTKFYLNAEAWWFMTGPWIYKEGGCHEVYLLVFYAQRSGGLFENESILDFMQSAKVIHCMFKGLWLLVLDFLLPGIRFSQWPKWKGNSMFLHMCVEQKIQNHEYITGTHHINPLTILLCILYIPSPEGN